EVDLDACLGTMALVVEHHTFTEQPMHDPLPQSETSAFGSFLGEHAALAPGRAEGAADLIAQPYLADQLGRNLPDKARYLVKGLAAIQPAGFRPGDDQLLHGPGDTDVGQTALLL